MQVFSIALALTASLQLCPMPVRSLDGFEGCISDRAETKECMDEKSILNVVFFSLSGDNVNARWLS